MAKHTETRWAVWNYEEKRFSGMYAWRQGVLSIDRNACKVPTFRTRDLARKAIHQMISSRNSRPVRVNVESTVV